MEYFAEREFSFPADALRFSSKRRVQLSQWPESAALFSGKQALGGKKSRPC